MQIAQLAESIRATGRGVMNKTANDIAAKTPAEEANYKVLLERAEQTLLQYIQRGAIPNDVRHFLEYRKKLMSGKDIEDIIGTPQIDLGSLTEESSPEASKESGYSSTLSNVMASFANKRANSIY